MGNFKRQIIKRQIIKARGEYKPQGGGRKGRRGRSKESIPALIRRVLFGGGPK